MTSRKLLLPLPLRLMSLWAGLQRPSPLGSLLICEVCLPRCTLWPQQPQQAHRTAATAAALAERPRGQPRCSARRRWRRRRRPPRPTGCHCQRLKPRQAGQQQPSRQPTPKSKRPHPEARARAQLGVGDLLQAAAQRAPKPRRRSRKVAARLPSGPAAASVSARQSVRRLRSAVAPRRRATPPPPQPRPLRPRRPWP